MQEHYEQSGGRLFATEITALMAVFLEPILLEETNNLCNNTGWERDEDGLFITSGESVYIGCVVDMSEALYNLKSTPLDVRFLGRDDNEIFWELILELCHQHQLDEVELEKLYRELIADEMVLPVTLVRLARFFDIDGHFKEWRSASAWCSSQRFDDGVGGYAAHMTPKFDAEVSTGQFQHQWQELANLAAAGEFDRLAATLQGIQMEMLSSIRNRDDRFVVFQELKRIWNAVPQTRDYLLAE